MAEATAEISPLLLSLFKTRFQPITSIIPSHFLLLRVPRPVQPEIGLIRGTYLATFAHFFPSIKRLFIFIALSLLLISSGLASIFLEYNEQDTFISY